MVQHPMLLTLFEKKPFNIFAAITAYFKSTLFNDCELNVAKER